MAFFKKRTVGRVYVIKMVLPDQSIIHKIGMCHSHRSTDRMMEILRSWFIKYRFIPYAELRLDMETQFPVDIEAHIHKVLRHKQFIPNEKVSGGTEMFIDINEFRVIHFLKNCNKIDFSSKLKVSDEDYKNLGKLISP